ncbi:Alpha/Beta hydrolase protein [Xylogone sp. PMI_703]|nr:Alpha/Beta hydrolase protein [Xylogone sp. PMI_703]
MSVEIPKPNKQVTVPSGNTYAYIHHPPTDVAKPTLLFLHGFPSTSADWRYQIPFFKQLGYGLLVPDLLGYGQSSKPTDKAEYTGKKLVADIIAVLDHENISGPIVGIAHDWGTYVLSQLAIYHQDRFSKFVFVSAPFTPPCRGLNLEALNAANAFTEQTIGYPCFGYMLFFNEESAGKFIGDHRESFLTLLHPDDITIWATEWAPVGALKKYLEEDKKSEMAPYMTPEAIEHHHASLGDDYSAPLNWYKRSIADIGSEEEAELAKQGKLEKTLKKDTLMVAGLKDAVCLPFVSKDVMPKVVEGELVEVDIDSGHWLFLDRPEEFNKVLKGFLERSKK